MPKIKRYEKYKDSRIEWIREVPEHWEVRKLKRVTKFNYGESLSSEKRIEGDIPVYGSNGIVGYHNYPNTLKPAIIIGRKGSYGEVAFSNEKCFAIDTTFYVDKSLTNMNMKWLYFLLQVIGLNEISQDTGVPGLSREKAYNEHIMIPPIWEQEHISSFLDKKTSEIDSLIADKEKLIEKLQEYKQSLITKTVTKGLEPNVKKDSGIEWIGEVPEHWGLSIFRRYCKVNQGLQIAREKRFHEPGVNRFPYITVDEVNSNRRGLDFKEYIKHPSKSVICEKDDILLARTGATGEVITGYKGVFHNNFFKINYNKKSLDKDFLIYYLSNEFLKEHVKVLAGITTIPDLNHGDFLNVPLIIPPIKEQKEISSFLINKENKIDLIISKINNQIQKLQEYRQSLITHTVTGKIDVRDYFEEGFHDSGSQRENAGRVH